MSPSYQLPLPYEPPSAGPDLDHARQLADHLSAIYRKAEQLRTTLLAFEAGRAEAADILNEIMTGAEQAELLNDLLRTGLVESGRRSELLEAQRNEALHDRDQLLRGLYAFLMRAQRKADSA